MAKRSTGRARAPGFARGLRAAELLAAGVLGGLLPLAVAGLPAPLTAAVPLQEPDGATVTVGLGATPSDSADLLDDAREAQRRFEYVRRRHLPVTFARAGGDCDDRVGRMCWTHATGSLWTPEPEDSAVVKARSELLGRLAGIGAALPGDGWVLGQRVWYLLEAGRGSEALELATRCGGAPAWRETSGPRAAQRSTTGVGAPSRRWWCKALEGLVLHLEGRYSDAGDAFGRALNGMEPERAREWEEVRDLLDGEARGLLDDATERSWDERRELVDRLWRLADPFLLVPGNERRSEHLARRTVARIRSEARNPHNLSWGDDQAELLVRYGWGVGWERVPARPGGLPGSESVIGHEHPDSRSFVPPGSVLRDPGRAAAEAWTPGLAYAPSAYAPAYAPVVLPMASRIVVLHRGDRALVAAPWALPPDTTRRAREGVRAEHRPPPAFEGHAVEAGLFLTGVEAGEVHRTPGEGGEVRRGVLVTEVPVGSYWVSVEVLDAGSGRAGRLRRGLAVPRRAPDLAQVSELMLLQDGPLPTGAEEALRRLRHDDRLVSGGSVVVAWELWGLGWREEILGYRLSLLSDDGGLLHQVGQVLGLVDPDRPSTVEWEEPGPERPGPAFRSLEMAVPSVEPGVYGLRLEIETPGRTALVTERSVRVVAPGEGGAGS